MPPLPISTMCEEEEQYLSKTPETLCPEKDRQMAFYSPLNGEGARDTTVSKNNAVWMKREGNQVNDENEITECTTHLSDQFCPARKSIMKLPWCVQSLWAIYNY